MTRSISTILSKYGTLCTWYQYFGPNTSSIFRYVLKITYCTVDRQEVLYNTQCQVCVLIDSVSRHFRMRSFRFGSWKRFISGAPGSAGSGSGSGSGSGTEGDLELDSSEQDEQLIDLLDRAGKPLRLWLHSREPASKFVQARQSYFVASVLRTPSFFCIVHVQYSRASSRIDSQFHISYPSLSALAIVCFDLYRILYNREANQIQ